MTYGENIDLENKSSCNAGFTIDFTNKAALRAYATHPKHQKLSTELVGMCVNGGDSIIVFDIVLE